MFLTSAMQKIAARLIVGIIILDQASKYAALHYCTLLEPIYVAPFWNWFLVYNPGAAFGFLAEHAGWQRYFLSALAIIVSIWLWLQIKKEQNKKIAIAFAFIIAGALGNVIDRLRFGAVIDFIQWHYAGYYWPAFNVADSAITVGAALLLIFSFYKPNKK